ncbi:hypothetical protein B9H47_004907 [Escherichia coli]|nr:hypothetical protein [Escherichia coli]EFF2737369.1 hypothetical protein [Escherichia coli]
MSAHFVRFPDCQFVDHAEQLWHENGRMICCPVARTARLRGGRRGAKNCRHCASVPVTQTRRNRDRMWECRTAHARSDIPHLVRASPRHPANASRHAKKFRVPLTVLELVKQKIAGPRASGVGSDFVIDDGTGKTLGMVVGVTE